MPQVTLVFHPALLLRRSLPPFLLRSNLLMPGFLPPRVFPDGGTKKIEREGEKNFFAEKKFFPLPSFFPRFGGKRKGGGGREKFSWHDTFLVAGSELTLFRARSRVRDSTIFFGCAVVRNGQKSAGKKVGFSPSFVTCHPLGDALVRPPAKKWQFFIRCPRKRALGKNFFRRPKNIAGRARGGSLFWRHFFPSLTVCRLEQ